MEIKLFRLKNDGDTTIGTVKHRFITSKIHTLEDEPREVKIKGETRIPAGRYEIKERKELSGLTKKYRKKFAWFKWHLQLQNVPNFKWIYIHIMNNDDHSDGCIGVGYETGDYKIWQSTQAFKDLYFFIVGALRCGERVFINIVDKDGK